MSIEKQLRVLIKQLIGLTLFRRALSKILKAFYRVQARRYINREALSKYFIDGDQTEIAANLVDLHNLHSLIKKRKPKVVLEFGVGFSTLVIADALKKNTDNGYKGRLLTVDAEPFWLENTQQKLPDYLRKFVQFVCSDTEVGSYQGQLCHYFKLLPDIVPNFIYLDGPSPKSVKGENNWRLSFGRDGKQIRPAVSADILLYESTAPIDFFILIDGRYDNFRFLSRNLRGKYKIKRDLARKFSTFEYLG